MPSGGVARSRACRWLLRAVLVAAVGICATPVARLTAAAPVARLTAAAPVDRLTAATQATQYSLAATFFPCGAEHAPCDTEPAQLQVAFPAGQSPEAVQLAWAPASPRPPGAPQPAATSALLDTASAVSCGPPTTTTGGAPTTTAPPTTTTTTTTTATTTTVPGGGQTLCWAWPAALRYQDRSILNGTYRVTACAPQQPTQTTPQQTTQTTQTTSQQSTGCTSSGPYQPAVVGLAVPPPPPAGIRASSAGSTVEVSWSSPLEAPPDLAGYLVNRAGQAVYYCSLLGETPACPQPLRFVDHPPAGAWTYQVQALSLGAGGPYPAEVESPPASSARVVVTVAQVPGGAVSLPPVPVGGVATATTGTTTIPATLPGEDTGAPGGPVHNLSYPPSQQAGAGDVALRETGAGRPDVLAAGLVALAVLIAAVAAHLLYLRSLVESRAGRKALRDGKFG
jgi:hypothetical protein